MKSLALILAALIASTPVFGRVARQPHQSRVPVNNRSAHAAARPAARPAGQPARPSADRNLQRDRNLQADRNASRDRNLDANRNVDRSRSVDRNIDVDRDIDVDYDHDWGWGSFAAGAAIGATTGAIVGAATSEPTTVVVATPMVGTTVATLPGGCAAVGAGSTVIYNCNNVFYQPFYQGSTLAYQVVTYP
ncbi:MAG: hypothetical protein WD696_03505 [Bryobacteraceae bacterium]